MFFRDSVLSSLVVVSVLSGLAAAQPQVVVNTTIYWSDHDQDQLLRTNIGGGIHEPLAPITNAYQLKIVESQGKIYWIAGGEVQRSNLDGTNKETVVPTWLTVGPSYVTSFAVDPVANKIYWAEYCEDSQCGLDALPKIIRTCLDAPCSSVIIADNLGNIVQSMALDPLGGKIYWSQQSSVRRADLNGANAVILAQHASNLFDSVVLDAAQGHLYFSEYVIGDATIERINLDGTGRQTIFAGDTPRGYSPPGNFAMDFVGGKVYWLQTIANKTYVSRANFDGTAREDYFYHLGHSAITRAGPALVVASVTVPAASTWGLALFSILLLIVGTLLARRRWSVV